jgi:hypothetical protein
VLNNEWLNLKEEHISQEDFREIFQNWERIIKSER